MSQKVIKPSMEKDKKTSTMREKSHGTMYNIWLLEKTIGWTLVKHYNVQNSWVEPKSHAPAENFYKYLFSKLSLVSLWLPWELCLLYSTLLISYSEIIVTQVNEVWEKSQNLVRYTSEKNTIKRGLLVGEKRIAQGWVKV